jgi:hypothetical protein
MLHQIGTTVSAGNSVMERRRQSYEYKATEMNAPGTRNRFLLPNYGSRH